MAAKAKSKKAKTRKTTAVTRRRPAKKSAKKKTALKKRTAKKKVLKKSPSRKTAKKKIAGRTTTTLIGAKEPVTIEPGPPGVTVPPVEEPAENEEAIGTVTHYYSTLGVAIVQINKGMLRTGDRIRLKGHTTDFTQTIESMEYEHQHVDQASPGQSVGLKVSDHAREHDILYRLR